jgi:hypothetical protein
MTCRWYRFFDQRDMTLTVRPHCAMVCFAHYQPQAQAAQVPPYLPHSHKLSDIQMTRADDF